MSLKYVVSKSIHYLRVSCVALIIVQFTFGGLLAAPSQAQSLPQTATPIKHVIVLIGENRTFDHVFATYVPKSGDSISNLLSEDIITADGLPGHKFKDAALAHRYPSWRQLSHRSLATI